MRAAPLCHQPTWRSLISEMGAFLGKGSTNTAGYFRLDATATKDRVSHHYVITRNGVPYDLYDASVVSETEDAKVVELRVRL